jgi:hypothetical protein
MNSVKKIPTPNLPVPGVVAANGRGGEAHDAQRPSWLRGKRAEPIRQHTRAIGGLINPVGPMIRRPLCAAYRATK